MKPYVVTERDDEYMDEVFLALYAGEDLNPKYPDSYHFYLYIDHANLWERHAFKKDVEYREPHENERREFFESVLGSRKFTISS